VAIQDAFDRGWWERVSDGVAPSLADVPWAFDLTVGGSLCDCFSDRIVRII